MYGAVTSCQEALREVGVVACFFYLLSVEVVAFSPTDADCQGGVLQFVHVQVQVYGAVTPCQEALREVGVVACIFYLLSVEVVAFSPTDTLLDECVLALG